MFWKRVNYAFLILASFGFVFELIYFFGYFWWVDIFFITELAHTLLNICFHLFKPDIQRNFVKRGRTLVYSLFIFNLIFATFNVASFGYFMSKD